MTGLEKWRKEQHEDIDSTFKDEAYEKIMDRELNRCCWCIYWDTSIDCSKDCEMNCREGIKAYLERKVQE